MEDRVVEIWRGLLGVSPGPDESFLDGGGDSLLAVLLVDELRQAFGVALSPAVVFTGGTVTDIAAAVCEAASYDGRGCLVHLRTETSTRLAPILCVHAVSGTVNRYAHLAPHLPPSRAVLGVQAPGINPTGGLHHSVEAMVEEYTAAVDAAVPHLPRILLGYSMGAAIALEMARVWHARGRPVLLVSLDGTVRQSATAPRRSIERRLNSLIDHLHLDPRPTLRDGMTLDAKLSSVLAACREQRAAVHDEMSLAYLKRFLSMEDVLYEAFGRFHPSPFDIRAIMMRSEMATDPLDLHRYALGGVKVEPVPGDHDSMISHNAEVIASRLIPHLDEFDRRTRGADKPAVGMVKPARPRPGPSFPRRGE